MQLGSWITEFSPSRRSDGRLRMKMFYTGTSMNPTLRTGDLLHVIPMRAERICCGDVVVFIVDVHSQAVAHRIVSRTDAGFVSMGDNNASPDSYLFQPSQVIGRVDVAENRGKARRIHRGLRGRVEGVTRRLCRLAERKVCNVLRPFYQLLDEWSVLRRIGFPVLQTKVVTFCRPTGDIELQLFWKDSLIGRLSPGAERWVIRRPFRLLIDEKSLPMPARGLQKEASPC